jgi:predicted YcjX-like family ATPase
MNKDIELDNFNLVVGANFDHKVYLIAKDLKDDPEVEVIELSQKDKIIEKTNELVCEINKHIEYYEKNSVKKESKIKWLVIEDYLSCLNSIEASKDDFYRNLTSIVEMGKYANIKVLIGIYKPGIIPVQIRSNMKIINNNEVCGGEQK